MKHRFQKKHLIAIILTVVLLFSAIFSTVWYIYFRPVEFDLPQDFDLQDFKTWFDWEPEKRPNSGNFNKLTKDWERVEVNLEEGKTSTHYRTPEGTTMEDVVCEIGKPHYLTCPSDRYYVIWDCVGSKSIIADMGRDDFYCWIVTDKAVTSMCSWEEYKEETIRFCNNPAV